MNIIRITPNENGAYPGIQSWDNLFPPAGYAVWPEELDSTEFYAYNGFVTLTVEAVETVLGEEPEAMTVTTDTVTSYEVNVDAWETWKADLPEPQPTQPTEEEDTAAMLIDHEYRLTLLELGVC